MSVMAMADRTPPVYGRPTLYGEYEINAADRTRAAALYGFAPKNVAAKLPVKAKKVASKKSAAKKKTAKMATIKKMKSPVRAARVQPVDVAADVIVVPARENMPDVKSVPVVEKPSPRPTPAAVAIAASATAPDAPGLDAFCTQRGRLHKGARPDGIILMPGRPDLMSCSDKE